MSRDNAIVRFDSKFLTASITRPSNTAQYTAGDVIAAVTSNDHFVFGSATSPAVNLGSNTGLITGARITSSANQSTKLDGQLFLFHTDVTEVADNTTWTPSDAELISRIGVIDFPVANWFGGDLTSGAGGNSGCDVSNLGIVFRANSIMYGVLIARNAYTPVSGEQFTIELLATVD